MIIFTASGCYPRLWPHFLHVFLLGLMEHTHTHWFDTIIVVLQAFLKPTLCWTSCCGGVCFGLNGFVAHPSVVPWLNGLFGPLAYSEQTKTQCSTVGKQHVGKCRGKNVRFPTYGFTNHRWLLTKSRKSIKHDATLTSPLKMEMSQSRKQRNKKNTQKIHLKRYYLNTRIFSPSTFW